MEDEDQLSRSLDLSVATTKILKNTLLLLVWVAFLGSNYLTITHLTTWLRKGYWPVYSTANLISDLKIAPLSGIRSGTQTYLDWLMSEPAAYSLMGLAIVLSVTMTLMPYDLGALLSFRRNEQ